MLLEVNQDAVITGVHGALAGQKIIPEPSMKGLSHGNYKTGVNLYYQPVFVIYQKCSANVANNEKPELHQISKYLR
jgi:hypothetical protein